MATRATANPAPWSPRRFGGIAAAPGPTRPHCAGTFRACSSVCVHSRTGAAAACLLPAWHGSAAGGVGAPRTGSPSGLPPRRGDSRSQRAVERVDASRFFLTAVPPRIADRLTRTGRTPDRRRPGLEAGASASPARRAAGIECSRDEDFLQRRANAAR